MKLMLVDSSGGSFGATVRGLGFNHHAADIKISSQHDDDSSRVSFLFRASQRVSSCLLQTPPINEVRKMFGIIDHLLCHNCNHSIALNSQHLLFWGSHPLVPKSYMNGPFAAAAALALPILLLHSDLFVGSGEFPPFLHLLIRRRFVSYQRLQEDSLR